MDHHVSPACMARGVKRSPQWLDSSPEDERPWHDDHASVASFLSRKRRSSRESRWVGLSPLGGRSSIMDIDRLSIGSNASSDDGCSSELDLLPVPTVPPVKACASTPSPQSVFDNVLHSSPASPRNSVSDESAPRCTRPPPSLAQKSPPLLTTDMPAMPVMPSYMLRRPGPHAS